MQRPPSSDAAADPPRLAEQLPVAEPATRVLSATQLALLAEHGEERTAEVGDTLYQIGDETYPFIAIIDGEAVVRDGAGQEFVRHGSAGFLGEINLLSGQTVFVTAVVTQPMRYIAVDREVLRQLLYEDSSLSDLVLSAFVERRELLQQRHGIGVEIIGARDAPDTRRLLDFARSQKLPHEWFDPAQDGAVRAGTRDSADLPLVRLPGGGGAR